VGLAVFAADALSSTAYATQEVLVILAGAGTLAFGYVFPISIVIVALLAIVVLSYEQIIHAYPGGGGAYIVASDNLGKDPGAGCRGGVAHRLHPDRFCVHFLRRGADRFGIPAMVRVSSRHGGVLCRSSSW
jgi:amino acid transporter